jgi:hypothetical protein
LASDNGCYPSSNNIPWGIIMKTIRTPALAAAAVLALAACAGDDGATPSAALPSPTIPDATSEASPSPSMEVSMSPDPSMSPDAGVGGATGTPDASASMDASPSAEVTVEPDASASPDGGLDGWPAPNDQTFAFFRDSSTGELMGGILLARLSNGTGVTLGLDPSVAGPAPITAHLHDAGCDATDPGLVQDLGTWTDGASSTVVLQPYDSLVGQGYSVGLHTDTGGDDHIACAEIDGNGTR